MLKIICLVLVTVSVKSSSGQELMSYPDNAGKARPVKTVAEWQKKRVAVLDSMQAVMGDLYATSEMAQFKTRMRSLPPLNVKYKDSLKSEKYTRYTIKFTPAKNESIYAYLYIPLTKSPIRLPAMLALHPTGDSGKKIVDGQGPRENRAYGKELAERGYVVIAPDYPGFGEAAHYDFFDDRYASGTVKAVFDNIRCIDLLQTRADVDPNRIGVIGHSLGGHNAIFTAAFDERLKVVVSSCGWTLMDHYNAGKSVTEKYGGLLGPWAQERYMPLIREKYFLDPAKIPFDFDEVIAAIAPRGFFSNSPTDDGNFSVEGVWLGIRRISRVYRLLNADGNLQVRYPQAAHDFPPEVRLEAYRFIDKMLQPHSPF